MPVSNVIAEVTLGIDAMSLDLTALDLSDWISADLVIKAQTSNGPWDRCILRFNDDAGASGSYIWSVQNDDNSRANSTSGVYIKGIESAHASGPDANTLEWGFNALELFRPGASDVYKHMIIRGSMPISTWALGTHGGGIWKNKNPITKISVIPNDGVHPWKAGSKLILIGTSRGNLTPYVPPLPIDDFNRANGPIGSPWIEYGASPGTLTITSNQLRGNVQDNPDHGAVWNGDSFTADHYSQFTVITPPGGGQWVGPTVRASLDGNNNYLVIVFNGSMQIYKKSGTYSPLGSSVGVTLNANDVMRLEAQGTTIRSYINGVLKNTVTDGTIVGPDHPGFAFFATPVVLDNWSAGNL